MNNPTKLLHTDIIVVEVPRDAGYFEINNNILSFDPNLNTELGNWVHLDLKGNFELVGEATETEISDSLEKFLKFEWSWTEQDLRDLLQASGLYWVNQIEKPQSPWQDKIMEEGLHHNYKLKLQKWQESEKNKIQGKIVLLKKYKMTNQEKQSLVHQEFVNSMINELNNNSHKGEWIDFTNKEEIHKEIDYHFKKLLFAEDWHKYNFSEEIAKDKIKEYIADVANLLMMLGNSYGIYGK